MTTYIGMMKPAGGMATVTTANDQANQRAKDMKQQVKTMKIGILIILAVFLSACSTIEHSFYRGAVEKVRQYPTDGKTTISFNSGKTITCLWAGWIEQGDLITIKNSKPDGRYFSNCEFCRGPQIPR